jgi:hypothetical protein
VSDSKDDNSEIHTLSILADALNSVSAIARSTASKDTHSHSQTQTAQSQQSNLSSNNSGLTVSNNRTALLFWQLLCGFQHKSFERLNGDIPLNESVSGMQLVLAVRFAFKVSEYSHSNIQIHLDIHTRFQSLKLIASSSSSSHIVHLSMLCLLSYCNRNMLAKWQDSAFNLTC